MMCVRFDIPFREQKHFPIYQTFNLQSSWVVYMKFPAWNILMILSALHVFKTTFCRLYLAISDKTHHSGVGDFSSVDRLCAPIFADHDLKTDSFEVVLLKIMISAHLSLYPKAINRIKIKIEARF